VPPNAVQVTVNSGWITLRGDLDWQYQRIAAEDAVRHLNGVAGIISNVTVRPHVAVEQVKHKIEDALRSAAELEAKRINVAVSGATVTLDGRVRDAAERSAVNNAAASAPGVQQVEDLLTVD
jgi:osmotically-inducible protein OsmY